MIYLLFCFFTFFYSIIFSNNQDDQIIPCSTTEQISCKFISDDYLIGNLINPISGSISIASKEILEQGSQEISVYRYYNPPVVPSTFGNGEKREEYDLYSYLQKTYVGWSLCPHVRLFVICRGKDSVILRITQPDGITLDYRVYGDNYSQIKLDSKEFAISNFGNLGPSGTYDLRNLKIQISDKQDYIHILFPDGAQRNYKTDNDSYYLSYLLEKEILPNGKVIKFYYSDDKKYLKKVQTTDPKERYVYAELYFHLADHYFKYSKIDTSSGKHISYSYYNKFAKGKLDSIKYKILSPFCLTNAKGSYVSDEIKYDNKFLLSHYKAEDYMFSCSYRPFGENENSFFRISSLLLPVGNNDSYQSCYEINYEVPIPGKKKGKTIAKKKDGTTIIYDISKNVQITGIRHYRADGTIAKDKKMQYFDNGWIKSITNYDKNDGIISSVEYEYDEFGNPVKETISGNLSGENFSKNIIYRKYSKDGRNLILEEKKSDGLTYVFQYLRDTNLPVLKLTKDSDKIIIREFFEYDDCNNLVKKIKDDGVSENKCDLTGMSQRLVTCYFLRNDKPFLHMIKAIEEKFLDENGKEKLIKRIEYSYDKYGNIQKETHYDENNIEAYSIQKRYSDDDRLIYNTNALGYSSEYFYDGRKNLVKENKFSDQTITYKYDLKKRITEKNVEGKDNISHITEYKYAIDDNPIIEIDNFKNTIKYEYDPVFNKKTLIEYPSIFTVDDTLNKVELKSSYDELGRKKSSIDANGNKTSYLFNAYGSVTKKILSDGSKEIFRYYDNGNLKFHVDAEGFKTLYAYDVLGRVTSKQYFYNNIKLSEESFIYNSFHLLSYKDKNGYVSNYYYDKQGRIVKKDKEGRSVEYCYDSLGRIKEVIESNVFKTVYERDLLDRIVEESIRDIYGNVLQFTKFSYDKSGNKTRIIKEIDGKEFEEKYDYDSFNRIISYTDPLNNGFKTVYNEKFLDKLNRYVMQSITANSNNIKTIITYDVLNRKSEETIKNNNDQTISSKSFIYDPAGNLTYRKDDIYNNEDYINSIYTKFTYNHLGNIKDLFRGFGSKDERKTCYKYFPSGRLKSKTFPDGVSINYSYAPDGLVRAIYSNDNSIDQSFNYDNDKNLLLAEDNVQKTSFERIVNPFGNILEEHFSNGSVIKKDYDDLGRCSRLYFSDNDYIEYQYDSLYLKKVSRFSNNECLYSHEYNHHDKSGNVLSQSLINNLGTVFIQYDEKSRKTAIESDYFNQHAKYDEKNNLVSLATDKNYCDYLYNDIDQLIDEKSSRDSNSFSFDSTYDLLRKNEDTTSVNNLNELEQLGNNFCKYDLRGNLTSKKNNSQTWKYFYDAQNRLVNANNGIINVIFNYDAIGRRLSKTTYEYSDNNFDQIYKENFFYNNKEEFGSFDDNKNILQLKIPGNANSNISSPIAIETKNNVFAPITDIQGNISSLINIKDLSVITNEYSSFGSLIRSQVNREFIPWGYANKRIDPETRLIYFGSRYYDPELIRWMTVDPEGFADSINLYQYVFNNPFRYMDPDGNNAAAVGLSISVLEWVFGASISCPLLIPVTLGATAATLLAYGTYTLIKTAVENGYNPSAHYVGQSCVNYHADAKNVDNEKTKNKDNNKRHTPDQEALNDIAKETTRKGVSNADADTILDWAKEYDYPARDDRGKPHWDAKDGMDHIHLEPKHIPVLD